MSSFCIVDIWRCLVFVVKIETICYFINIVSSITIFCIFVFYQNVKERMSSSAIAEILKNFQRNRSEALIPVLQEVQEADGYISELAVRQISEYLGIPSSKIYGVATFYNQFRFSPRGKFHIQVCFGTACHIMGSSTVLEVIERLLKIKDGQCSKDGLFSLEVGTCTGGCGQAPVIVVNGVFYGKVTEERIKQIIAEMQDEAI